MYVSSIFLDRFGRHSALRIDGLSEGLNFVHGPKGSGKSTLIAFLHAMWTGFPTDLRNRYLPRHSRGFGGCITVETPQGQRTISRYDDGSHDGRVTIEHQDGSVIGRRQVGDWNRKLPYDLVRMAFCIDFERRPTISALWQTAVAAGLADAVDGPDHHDSSPANELDSLRDELSKLPGSDSPLDEWEQRQREVRQAIRDLDAGSGASAGRAPNELQQHIQRLRQELRDLAAQLRPLQEAREDFLPEDDVDLTRSRRRPLRGFNAKLARWQKTLEDIVTRRAKLLERTAGPNGSNGRTPEDAARQTLVDLVERMEQWQQSATRLASTPACTCQPLQDSLRTFLPSIHRNVKSLQRTLDHASRHGRRDRDRVELEELAACEATLRQAIERLVQRRQAALTRLSARSSTTYDNLTRELAALKERERLRQTQLQAALDEFARWEQAQRHGSDSVHERRETLEDELRAIEAEISVAAERQRLEHEIAELESLRARETESESSTSLLRNFSRYLQHLTDGACRQMRTDASGQVCVEQADGRRVTDRELDAGTADLVYLAGGLAIVAAAQELGVQMPLVLNAAFSNLVAEQVRNVVEVLHDFGDGRQVLCLTRHEQVVREARELALPVITLAASATESPAAQTSEPARAPKLAVQRGPANDAHPWDAEEFPGELTDRVRASMSRSPSRPVKVTPVVGAPPTAAAAPIAPPEPVAAVVQHVESEPREPVEVSAPLESKHHEVKNDEPASLPDSIGEFHLYEFDSIERAPSMDAATVSKLRRIGVMRVGDLLRISPMEAAGELRSSGVSAEHIQTWQWQSRLMCQIRGLLGYDARVLVACGITDPKQLGDLGCPALRQRVKEFAKTDEGQAILLSGTEEEFSRITDWMHARPEAAASPADEVAEQPKAPPAERRRDSKRKSRRDAKRQRGHAPTATTTSSDDEPTFHLVPADPIRRIPSIGPNVATRFESIGVSTVGRLLEVRPEAIAPQLELPRVTADVIRRWQREASLVCSIPGLRGWQASVLVHVGVLDRARLAGQKPALLHQQLQTFAGSVEGRRIREHFQEPTLDEVSAWIRASRNSVMQAAA